MILVVRNFPVPQPTKEEIYSIPAFLYHCAPFTATFFRSTCFCEIFYLHFVLGLARTGLIFTRLQEGAQPGGGG